MVASKNLSKIEPSAPSGEKGKMRRCPYCRSAFKPPDRRRGDEARFCSAAHRKLWHKYGSLSMERLERRMRQYVDEKMIGMLEHVDKIAAVLEALQEAVEAAKNRMDQKIDRVVERLR